MVGAVGGGGDQLFAGSIDTIGNQFFIFRDGAQIHIVQFFFAEGVPLSVHCEHAVALIPGIDAVVFKAAAFHHRAVALAGENCTEEGVVLYRVACKHHITGVTHGEKILRKVIANDGILHDYGFTAVQREQVSDSRLLFGGMVTEGAAVKHGVSGPGQVNSTVGAFIDFAVCHCEVCYILPPHADDTAAVKPAGINLNIPAVGETKHIPGTEGRGLRVPGGKAPERDVAAVAKLQNVGIAGDRSDNHMVFSGALNRQVVDALYDEHISVIGLLPHPVSAALRPAVGGGFAQVIGAVIQGDNGVW